MGPINAALQGDQLWINICRNAPVKEALTNFCILIQRLGNRPTHCRELVVTKPGFIGFCDVSKLCAGGVWLSGTLQLAPVMWQLEWPSDIQRKVVSFANPNGKLTNSDLEMAGMLVHYLVLKHLISLRHMHVAAWCNNTPTVSWTNKLSSSRSLLAGCLTRALALCLHANEAPPW
jgi:hypothetical protein